MAFSALQVQAEENVDVAAPEAILIDRASGNVLYEKNSSTRRDPASLTKLMGLYIATMKLKDDMSITMSDAAYETYDHSSGVLWIQKEETLTVKDAEYASMLMSANDTMAMLAQAVGGDQDSFVAMMNRMAADLQMNDTHFNNIFGLYQEENYASAADLATLTRKALQQPTFAQLFGSSSYILSATNKNSQERVLPNDCQLLRSGAHQYDGITGGKIGSTTEGGYAISASAARNGTELIAVVMGEENAKNAYADVAKLFDYGFRTYQTVTISKDMIKPITVEVKEGRKHIADVIFSADGDFSLLLKGNVPTDTLTAEIQVENDRLLYVYISGAVKSPGVYSYKRPLLVGEVIKDAGGFNSYADSEAINAAAPIEDGLHIHIPYKTDGIGVAVKDDHKIHLNEADEKTLTSLNGIGPAMAAAIIAYRNEHGSFTSVEELKQVKGIGAAKYEKLKDVVDL